MTRTIEIVNWKTTRDLRSKLPFESGPDLPCKDVDGSKREIKKAGYSAEMTEQIIKSEKNNRQLVKLIHPVNVICLPVKWLRNPIPNSTRTNDKTSAGEAVKMLSDRNCTTIVFLLAPSTLRITTSFSRVLPLAVAKFM